MIISDELGAMTPAAQGTCMSDVKRQVKQFENVVFFPLDASVILG